MTKKDLDALVAEKVMGWHIDQRWGISYKDKRKTFMREVENWYPSTRIENAMEVLRAFIDKYCKATIEKKEGGYRVLIDDPKLEDSTLVIYKRKGEAKTLPEAICRAAISEVQVTW